MKNKYQIYFHHSQAGKYNYYRNFYDLLPQAFKSGMLSLK